jgi:hypothetical protein
MKRFCKNYPVISLNTLHFFEKLEALINAIKEELHLN